MRGLTRPIGYVLAMLAAGTAMPLVAADYPQPLAEEPIPTTATLPDKYPDSWVFVHDLFFDSLLDGRATIVDVAADNHQVKGQVPVAQFGNITISSARGEILTGETFHSRLTRGDRTDVLTIWDMKTLAPKGEVVLPGCSLAYPTGPRGFTTLCADGTMSTITLDAAGKVASTVNSKPFNDIDDNPMFMTPAMVGKTAWFVTFKGSIRGIDFAGAAPRDLGIFNLPKTDGGTPEWRPGGWQVISSDKAGRLYVLMSPAGKEGSHKDGGTEVWVVDPAKKARVARIPLKNHSVSVEATQQEKPLLVASRPDGALDVYDAESGAFVRTIVGSAHDPMTMTAVR